MQKKSRDSNTQYSFLLPIKPYGENSGDLEILTSFICRNSECLYEGTSSFCRTLLHHFLDDPKLKTKRIVSHIERRSSNGIGITADRYIEALKNASNKTFDPTYLTLIPIKYLCDISSRGLQKRYRVWCDSCWLEDCQSNRTPYIRQYWMIQPTNICAHHHIALKDCCPTCGKSQSVLPNFPKQWICDHCNDSLYEQNIREYSQEVFFEDKWKSLAIYNLIDRLNRCSLSIKKGTLKNAIEDLKRSTNLEVEDLSSRLKVSTCSFNNILSDRRPYFPSFIDICFRLDIPPDNLLFDRDILTAPELWRHRKKQCFYRQSRISDNKMIRIQMTLNRIIKEEATTPVKVSEIAYDFGISYPTLRDNFPKEYDVIRERYIKWREEKKKKDHTARIKKIFNAVITLAEKEIYPSDRQLRDRNLVKPSDLRREELLPILRELQTAYSHLLHG